MENYSGIFMLLVIAWAAWATEKYFTIRRKYVNLRNRTTNTLPNA